MSRIAQILQDLQLDAYLEAFLGNDIDDDLLAGLTTEDLKEIGVASLGHRKKILDAIAASPDLHPQPATQNANPAPPVEAPTEQRREVAVVFADLTGYTRLINRLAVEDMHAILAGFYDRFDAIVRRLGGTVDRHIGDCVMAVFGAPLSYGNDAERALRASIEMHAAMRDLSRIHGEPLSTHIGIAMGRVLYSSKGQGSLAEAGFTVTGSTINLASRLSDTAQGTETLISDRTYMEMRGQIDAEPVDGVEAKGFADKVKAFRLIGFKSARAQSDFVGRAAELGLAQSALATCRDGGTGQVIYLSGEAGIGKTSLLEQIIQRAAAMAFGIHRMLVLDFGLGEGQTLARSLLAQLTGLDENATASAVERAGQQLVAGGLLDEKSVHVFARAMGVRPEGAALLYLKSLDDAALARTQADVIAALVTDRAKAAPLLLAVEDIHWADTEATDLVGRLAQATANMPIVLVLTARPMDDEQDKTWTHKLSAARTTRFDLAPLTPDEAMELATRLQAPRADQVRKCLEKAEGNPLFLAQLLRHASEAGDDEVPGTIQSLVQAKIDRLSADDRRVLKAAAVIGQRFRIEAAMAIAGIQAFDHRALSDAGLIREFDDELLFSHALIRDGVYQTILRKELQHLHAGAAEWFRTTDSLLHAEHLEIAASPLAPAAFLRAARDAAASHRLTGAASLIERGLTLDPPPDVRVGLQLFLGDVLRDLGRGEESMRAFNDALTQTTVPEEVVEAQIGLVGTMRIMDKLDGAMPLIAEAIGTAERAGQTEQLSRLHYLKGSISFPKGDFQGCLEAHTRALDYAGQAGSPELEARALSGLGDAYYAQGRMFLAHDVFEKCLDLCTRHGLVAVEAANRFMLGTAKIYLNQTEAALLEAKRSVSLAREAGLLRPEIVSRLTAGWILQSLERSAEALAEVDQGIAAARALGAKRFEPFLRETAVRAHLSEGRREDAEAIAREVVAQTRELGAMRFIGPWVLATAAMASGEQDAANALLDEGDTLLASGCVGHNYYRFYAYGIVGCLDRGDIARARRYCDALAAYTAAEPAPWSDFFIAFGRAAGDFAEGAPDARDRLGSLADQAAQAGLLTSKRRIARFLERGRIAPEDA
jgi:class 3 adenylate cyclase/tetratricopeptide (TPR) repeat protein